jgi:hypothetical protein
MHQLTLMQRQFIRHVPANVLAFLPSAEQAGIVAALSTRPNWRTAIQSKPMATVVASALCPEQAAVFDADPSKMITWLTGMTHQTLATMDQTMIRTTLALFSELLKLELERFDRSLLEVGALYPNGIRECPAKSTGSCMVKGLAHRLRAAADEWTTGPTAFDGVVYDCENPHDRAEILGLLHAAAVHAYLGLSEIEKILVMTCARVIGRVSPFLDLISTSRPIRLLCKSAMLAEPRCWPLVIVTSSGRRLSVNALRRRELRVLLTDDGRENRPSQDLIIGRLVHAIKHFEGIVAHELNARGV